MTTTLEQGRPRLAPGYRMQWEAAQDCHVLLYPEGRVKLNASAHEILVRCGGRNTIAAIVDELQQAFPDAELEAEVWQFLRRADERGWIEVICGGSAA